MRLIVLERIVRPHPRLGEIVGGMRGHHLANALVSFLFACTGPVALILTVGIAGGLKPHEIASWISVAFGLGGVITFAMSYLYRQPLAMAWTIPGTAIVGASLQKFPYPEIVGAYVVTGALMLVLGLSGGFKKLMEWMPQPIVMAMVAGLFLKFGVLAIDGFDKAPIVAVAAAAGFVVFSFVKGLGRVIPPVVAALVAGGAAIAIVGGFQPREGTGGVFADPVFFIPEFSKAALLDLVLPLIISVVVLQNAQGIGILRMNRHDPPPNCVTSVCGVGTIVFGLFGAVCTCLTGPANALLCSSGEPRNHYIGALIWAGFAILFGLFAPAITGLALAVPDAFIYVIGGLAMLRVLQQTLTAAFGGKFALGAVVCMAVTVTELIPEARFALLGIGAPFWGLVFGIITSLLLEPGDFRELAAAARASSAVQRPVRPPPPPPPPRPQKTTRAERRAAAKAAAELAEAEARLARPRPPVPAWALEPDSKPIPMPPPDAKATPSPAPDAGAEAVSAPPDTAQPAVAPAAAEIEAKEAVDRKDEAEEREPLHAPAAEAGESPAPIPAGDQPIGATAAETASPPAAPVAAPEITPARDVKPAEPEAAAPPPSPPDAPPAPVAAPVPKPNRKERRAARRQTARQQAARPKEAKE